MKILIIKPNKYVQCLCLLVLQMVCLTAGSYAQGCSDAGFCTLDSFEPNSNFTRQKDQKSYLQVGGSFGLADQDISIVSNQLVYGLMWGDKTSVAVKLTSLAQRGNGISTFGLSDVFLTAGRQLDAFRLTLGIKVPLSKANKMHQALPLPMDYQSSLGTVDIILGLGYDLGKLQLALAWQKPIAQNKNSFDPLLYPLGSPLSQFTATSRFRRQSDALIRISYPLAVTKNLMVTPSMLPVYHLGDDTFFDRQNQKQRIFGSNGLTLNATVYGDYQLDKWNKLQLNFGSPLVTRKSRPDGLTRSFVVGLVYQYAW